MKKFISFILVALLPMVAFSDNEYSIHGCDAIIDGICYKFPSSSGDEAWVSYEWYHYEEFSTNTSTIEWIYTEPDYSGDIVIPETISYNGKTYRVTGINDYAFYDCPNLTSVTLPSSVKNIGGFAFSECKNLTSVILPDSMGRISSYAFSNCTGLASVSFPKGVKQISLRTFYKCSGLKTITIPQDVTNIQYEAFSYCNGLTDVYCLSKYAPNAGDAFDYVELAGVTLHVPQGSEDSYSSTSPWKNFGKAVTGITVDKNNFPDGAFRQWILEEPMGFDGVLTDEEIASVQKISLYYDVEPYFNDTDFAIGSMKGIEFFTELTELRLGGHYLTELDMTKNTKLKNLYCFDNYHDMKIDLSGCTALNVAFLPSCRITELNLSGCSALRQLECNGNKLQTLNVSGCTSLQEMDCSGNALTSLDVSGCTELIKLLYWKNKIKAPEMETLIESLPVTSTGTLYAMYNSSGTNDQNVMTTLQVMAAKAKGWNVKGYINRKEVDYAGSEPIEVVSFTAGQMATIILPTEPDASKGWYYRLDRCEGGKIIFEQELQPQARTPYVIVPSEDFCIDRGAFDLSGLSGDTVSIRGISFIGSYFSRGLSSLGGNEGDSFYIDIIDTTPDCTLLPGEGQEVRLFIGALRAYLQVNWDDPYNPGGTKGPNEKMEIVLKDDPDGINTLSNSPLKGEDIYDLSGKRISSAENSSSFILHSSLKKGLYIKDGKKLLKR